MLWLAAAVAVSAPVAVAAAADKKQQGQQQVLCSCSSCSRGQWQERLAVLLSSEAGLRRALADGARNRRPLAL